MHRESTPTFAQMIREHNSLNGLRFVLLEFFLVIVAALWISYSGMIHDRLLMSIVGIGISVNALAVIVIAAVQIRNHDKNEGFLKMRSPQFRAALGREHPNLGSHTFIVMLSVLVPFLLAALLTLQTVKSSSDKRS